MKNARSILLCFVPLLAVATSMAFGASSTTTKGQKLYKKNCASCHGAKAQGSAGPKLAGTKMSASKFAKTVNNGVSGEMPGFAKKLKASEIKAIQAYLKSLK